MSEILERAAALEEQVVPESYDVASLRVAMSQDLDTFAGITLPDVCTKPFSPLHHNAWQQLTDAVQRLRISTMEGREAAEEEVVRTLRYALGIPRGHAKTQMIKLFILYCILFSDIKYIMVIGNNAGAAVSIIDDVTDMLDSPNVIAIFGNWAKDIEKDNDNITLFEFTDHTTGIKRAIILEPKGNGSRVRGSNTKNTRPELIICDDMQSREEALSPEVAAKSLDWFTGTVYKARSNRRCLLVYIGNMYPDLEIGGRGSGIYGCILRNLQLMPEWLSWIGAAILADGTALWEEVIPLAELLADLRQDMSLGRAEIFYSELMNNPTSVGTKFLDPDKIPEYPYEDSIDLVCGRFMIIDPSLGKKKSDDQMVTLNEVIDTTGPIVREARNIQKSAPETVKETLVWALESKTPLICVESVAYQATLIQWFVHYIDLLGIEGIEVLPVTPRGQSKVSRILAMFKSLVNGSIILHPDVYPIAVAQAMSYDPSKTNNIDDLLDCIVYAEHVFVTYQHEYLLPIEHIHTNDRLDSISSTAEEPDYATMLGIN